MSQLEFALLKRIALGVEKTNELLARQNELLEKLTTQQQPKAEVISDKPNMRGKKNVNAISKY